MDDYISRQAAMLRVAKINPVRFKNLDDFHDACVDCLKELPSEDVLQWIPCNSDNMPDTNDEVLTTYIVNGDDKKRYVEAATWWKDDSDEGGYWTSLSDEYRKIGTRVERLAWRPMPAPWRSD